MKLPFEIKTHSTEMTTRTNPFSGESIQLPAFAASVYDYTMYKNHEMETVDQLTNQTLASVITRTAGKSCAMGSISSDSTLLKNTWCCLTKRVTLTVKNCSVGQWSTLLLELHHMAGSWKRFGPRIELQAPSLGQILAAGTKPQASGRKRHNMTTFR